MIDIICRECGEHQYPCGCMRRTTPTPVACPSCGEPGSEFTLSTELLITDGNPMYFVGPACDGRVLEEIGDDLFVRLEPEAR